MPEESNNRFGYVEPPKALDSRIESHKKYSNFDLHQWIRENFRLAPGDSVFDIGCGNGNYTSIFWDAVKPSGVVFGLDKNAALISEARKQHAALPAGNVLFEVGDFDRPFPIPAGLKSVAAGKLDWAFSIYALYYSADCARLARELHGYLKSGGRFVVIGPGAENALDLVEINQRLTGNRPNREYFERLDRIQREFAPIFAELFGAGAVTTQTLDSVMSFPTPQSFADYYWSTLLWREAVEGRPEAEVEAIRARTLELAALKLPVDIKKQVACLVAVKR